MINRVSGVSFNGIYDIKFPKGTSDEVINSKLKTVQRIIDNGPHWNDIITVEKKDCFDKKDTNRKLEQKGIRLVTTVDNPYIMAHIFEELGGADFMQREYINKVRTELILDVKA